MSGLHSSLNHLLREHGKDENLRRLDLHFHFSAFYLYENKARSNRQMSDVCNSVPCINIHPTFVCCVVLKSGIEIDFTGIFAI